MLFYTNNDIKSDKLDHLARSEHNAVTKNAPTESVIVYKTLVGADHFELF